jgi:hypothetical protein
MTGFHHCESGPCPANSAFNQARILLRPGGIDAAFQSIWTQAQYRNPDSAD